MSEYKTVVDEYRRQVGIVNMPLNYLLRSIVLLTVEKLIRQTTVPGEYSCSYHLKHWWIRCVLLEK